MRVCCARVNRPIGSSQLPRTLTCLAVVGLLCIRFSVTDSQKTENSLRGISNCPVNDFLCERDWIGYESIAQLHARIDDDKNGGLDRLESDEFIREDLNYADSKTGQASFHGSDDFITVQDLWQLWVESKAYKWTVDDVIDWLVNHVELPQYSDSFRINAIDGHVLPRLASNSHAIGSMLGIKNSVHRQKLSVKAMDLVMFGPPKTHHSVFVDIIICASVLIASFVTWFAYRERRSTDIQLTKLMQDMATLQSAEESLVKLQQQVEVTMRDQQKVLSDRYDLERRLQLEIDSVKGETEMLRRQHMTDEEQLSELKQTEEELNHLRTALAAAERQLEESYSLPTCLQPWLQLTYDVESRYFDTKRKTTESQLKAAKEMCEKLHSEKGQLFSALRMAHGSSLDDTDQKIFNVRCALEDTKRALQERMHRWQQIETLCGFSITASLSVGQDSSQTSALLKQSLADSKLTSTTCYAGQLDIDLLDDEMPALPLIAQVAASSSRDSSNNRDFPNSRDLPRAQTLPGLSRLSAQSRMDPDIGQLSQATPVRQSKLRYPSKMQKIDSARINFDSGEDSWSIGQSICSSDEQPGNESTPSTDSDGASSIIIQGSTVSLLLNESAIGDSVSSSERDSQQGNNDASLAAGDDDSLAPMFSSDKSAGKNSKRKSPLVKLFGKGGKRKES